MLTMTAVGRIGRDAELRRTGAGDPVCNVVIGCNYGKRDDNTTQWVEGTLWGARAEGLAEHLTKGKQVILVLADVHIETYEGNNGTGHKLIGRVQDLAFGAEPRNQEGGDAPRQQAQGRGTPPQRQQPQRTGGQQRQQPQRAAAPASGFDDMDDDIPFASQAFSHDEVSSIDRRKKRYDTR